MSEVRRTEVRHLNVSRSVRIAAGRDAVWDAVTGDLTPWWGSPYVLLDDPAPTVLHLEPRIGGLVLESNATGDALWGTVTEIRPGRLVTWTGAQGMGGAANGTVTIELADDDGGIRVDLHHESIGAVGEGTIDSYEYGWDDLLHRLAAYVEEGRRYGIAGEDREVDGFVHESA